MNRSTFLSTTTIAALTAATFVATAAPARAQAPIIITAATSINAANTTYENQDIIVRGATVTIDGTHTFRSMVIENNGVVTCSAMTEPNFVNGLRFNITNDLTVLAGGKINVSFLGHGNGSGPGAGQSNPNSGTGASFGGFGTGGVADTPYGDIRLPADAPSGQNFGSGGGLRTGQSGNGGRGGGCIKLTVGGILTHNGLITADGEGAGGNGGGSGGAIQLNANTLAGGGAVQAVGGGAGYGGGSGSGGRIAIYYTIKTFTGSILSRGDYSDTYGHGGAGTVYVKQNSQTYGDLIHCA